MVHQVTAHQKAMVLCWMWLADQATIKQEDPEAKSSSMSFAADIASDIVKKMFRLDVTAQSITNYYGLSQKNVEHAGIKWKYEVAAIMLRGLGKRLMTYHEFSGFLHEYDGKKPYPTTSARVMMLKVEQEALGNWNWLYNCWEEFASGRLTCPLDLDPELEVAHNTPHSPLTPTQKIQQGADPGPVNGDQET